MLPVNNSRWTPHTKFRESNMQSVSSGPEWPKVKSAFYESNMQSVRIALVLYASEYYFVNRNRHVSISTASTLQTWQQHIRFAPYPQISVEAREICSQHAERLRIHPGMRRDRTTRCSCALLGSPLLLFMFQHVMYSRGVVESRLSNRETERTQLFYRTGHFHVV